MPRLLLLLGILTAACPAKKAPVAEVTDSAPSAEEACVDQWLAAHHLDAYGGPEGTAYAGGTPAFDETTGKTTSRVEYVYRKQPDARRACAPEAGH